MKDNPITECTLLFLLTLSCCCFCKGAEHMKCNRTSYDKIACFKRNSHRGFRLFEILVMTDRDWSATQYGGVDIDWNNWENYIHGFACRCLERLKDLVKTTGKKYHHFSMLNYGECWTSEDVIYDLTQLDLDETCVGDDFLLCQREAESECFGREESQFVYHVNYEDEPVVDEYKNLQSECTIETMTVCSAPSHSYNAYASPTVQP
ncbi:uncharacterized protein LOC114534430 [Dendronephthya gigantea]|uniref:uncharacterized protein LOC114534430 n=1 Tax=Dendronephthya gigantea TaxID=151771 RepID=UPI00106C1572|nr:uncharacterized protein LOC114534430 [Dendronephthya gigantea]